MKRVYRPPHFRPIGKRPRGWLGKLAFGPYRRAWIHYWIFDYKAKHQTLRKHRYAIIRCDKGSGEWFYTEDELQEALKWYQDDDADWFGDIGLLIERWDGYGKCRWTMDVVDYMADETFMVPSSRSKA